MVDDVEKVIAFVPALKVRMRSLDGVCKTGKYEQPMPEQESTAVGAIVKVRVYPMK